MQPPPLKRRTRQRFTWFDYTIVNWGFLCAGNRPGMIPSLFQWRPHCPISSLHTFISQNISNIWKISRTTHLRKVSTHSIFFYMSSWNMSYIQINTKIVWIEINENWSEKLSTGPAYSLAFDRSNILKLRWCPWQLRSMAMLHMKSVDCCGRNSPGISAILNLWCACSCEIFRPIDLSTWNM